jgi:hypothetical protein
MAKGIAVGNYRGGTKKKKTRCSLQKAKTSKLKSSKNYKKTKCRSRQIIFIYMTTQDLYTKLSKGEITEQKVSV